MKTLRNFELLVLISIALPMCALAKSDMPGSNDHQKIPRIEGTSIIGYEYSDFDEGVFITGMEGQELLTETVEGKRTRILYLGPKELSPVSIVRNYEKALSDLGEVTEVFKCEKNTCFSNLGQVFIWSQDNQIPNKFSVVGGLNMGTMLYNFGHLYGRQSYWYSKVRTSDGVYHVSVFTATHDGKSMTPAARDRSAIHLEIVEIAEFTPTLTIVKAEEMSDEIARKGHIALYGIYFDSGSDMLKQNSHVALQEIAKALNADPGLKLYIVGHTDNEGTLEYNQELSKRRAKSVARALTSKHGIENDRLIPIGVGLAAPVATNDTEEGRALNRRVELVKR